jgi:hypothetical protein
MRLSRLCAVPIDFRRNGLRNSLLQSELRFSVRSSLRSRVALPSSHSGMSFMSWKLVFDRCPGYLGFHPDMHLWCWYIARIDHSERYTPECRNIGGLVPERRTARTTKSPKPTSRIELRDPRCSPCHDEMTCLNYAPRGIGRTGEFPARCAMAVSRTMNSSVNLE